MASNHPSSSGAPMPASTSTLSSLFKAQRFADVSEPFNIANLKSAFYSHITNNPFKQGSNPDGLSLCEEMCIDPMVFADIERICSIDNLKHPDGEEHLKSLNINNISKITGSSIFSIFRQ